MSSRFRRAIRTIRPGNNYLWNKQVTWEDVEYQSGDPIPDELADDRIALAKLLASRYIILDRSNVNEGYNTEGEPPEDIGGDAVTEVDRDAPAPLAGEGNVADESAPIVDGTVDWQSMKFADQVKLARSKGLTGKGMPSKKVLHDFLRDNV